MKPISFLFTAFVWTFLLFFSFSNLEAQEPQKENSACIELKKAGLSIADNEVLVAGDVFASYVIRFEKSPPTLARSIAMVGGIKNTDSIKITQIFKCSPNSEVAEGIMVKNLQNIKRGIEPDLKLKGGDIVLVVDKNSQKIPSVLKAFEPRCRGVCIE